MVDKLKRGALILLVVHFVVGFVVVTMLVLQPQMVIGVGQFQQMTRGLETFDFKWWIVALVAGYWLIPLILVVIWRRARKAGLEVDQLRDLVHKLLEDRVIPVMVDIDHTIPIEMDEPIRVPVELHTKLDIDDTVDIEIEVPIAADLPIDTNIKTSVLGIGSISIPIKAQLPINVNVPIKASTRIKATGLPVDIKEVALVEMRGIEIPVRARVETKIDLLRNLRTAEEAISKLQEPKSSTEG